MSTSGAQAATFTFDDAVRQTLHRPDEELIATVAEANARTAVVVIDGSAIIMEVWRHHVPAVLMAWYPGMEGGRAIADVLTGAQEPGGRLPVAIPTDTGHLPFFDARATTITYDSWWGQRKLDRDGQPAAYPFGFGLGYTTFDMELVDHRASDGEAVATVRVRDTGQRAGSTVAQFCAISDAADAVPQLVGFRRVELPAQGEDTVAADLDLTPTMQRDPETRTWVRRPGEWASTWSVDVAIRSPLLILRLDWWGVYPLPAGAIVGNVDLPHDVERSASANPSAGTLGLNSRIARFGPPAVSLGSCRQPQRGADGHGHLRGSVTSKASRLTPSTRMSRTALVFNMPPPAVLAFRHRIGRFYSNFTTLSQISIPLRSAGRKRGIQ
jgi:Glycosyl hydrolase family 3 C-terminal domain